MRVAVLLIACSSEHNSMSVGQVGAGCRPSTIDCTALQLGAMKQQASKCVLQPGVACGPCAPLCQMSQLPEWPPS